MRRMLKLSGALGFLAILVATATAEVPPLLNFQGKLTDLAVHEPKSSAVWSIEHRLGEEVTHDVLRAASHRTGNPDALVGGPSTKLREGITIAYEGSTLWTYVEDVAVRGGYAYCAMLYGLSIVDISNPSSPCLVSKVDLLEGAAWGVAMEGDHAYVADGDGGLQVINIANPHAPFREGSLYLGAWAYDVALAPPFAYVANGGGGLVVVDISLAAAPVEVGTLYGLGLAYGVAVAGSRAYVADAGGLIIVDVSNPQAPFPICVDRHANVQSVATVGNYVYAATWDSALCIFDTADCHLVGRYETPSRSWDVAVAGDYAYLACDYSGLLVVNVADPENPFVTGSYSPRELENLTIVPGFAYVAGYGGDLSIVDISDPYAPHLVGAYDTPGYVVDVDVEAGLAYVGDRFDGLHIVNVVNPQLPYVTGGCASLGFVEDVVVAGDSAYTAGPGKFAVVNVADPQVLVVAHSYGTPGWFNGAAIAGSRAYVANGNIGLAIFDLSSPEAPPFIRDTPGIAHGVVVSGQHAYVADGPAGLAVLNLSDPNALPVSCDTPGEALDVAILENRAIIADGDSGVQVVDITDPENPVRVLSWQAANFYALDLAIQGNYAYVAAWDLYVFNVAKPDTISLIGTYHTPEHAWGVAADGNHIYVADCFGFLVLSIECDCGRQGDVTSDGVINPTDVVYMICYALRVACSAPSADAQCPCTNRGDWDCNGKVDIVDIVRMVNYVYRYPSPGPVDPCATEQ